MSDRDPEHDRLIGKWLERHDRPGRPTCPCGFQGGSRTIRAHRCDCPVWHTYVGIMKTTDTPPPMSNLTREILEGLKFATLEMKTSIVLMQPHHERWLKEANGSQGADPYAMPGMQTFNGVPYEIHPNHEACIKRAVELVGEGKTVTIVDDSGKALKGKLPPFGTN